VVLDELSCSDAVKSKLKRSKKRYANAEKLDNRKKSKKIKMKFKINKKIKKQKE
jgi:hypothetical protein